MCTMTWTNSVDEQASTGAGWVYNVKFHPKSTPTDQTGETGQSHHQLIPRSGNSSDISSENYNYGPYGNRGVFLTLRATPFSILMKNSSENYKYGPYDNRGGF